MKPRVGWVVHYYGRGGSGPFAAIVSRVMGGGDDEGRCTLHVLDPDPEAREHMKVVQHVPFSANPMPGSWTRIPDD